MENLARYMIRASFSRERMTYIPEDSKVVYRSKNGKEEKAFDIQKIYEVDPLTCPKCQGRMRISAFIEDEEVIQKILKHLDLWDIKARPTLKRANAPPCECHIDYSVSQVPSCKDYLYCDPDYPIETCASA
jgi:hypothetical protein